MKLIKQLSTLSPGAGTVDLSSIAGITQGKVLAISNVTASALIYAVATPGYGASAYSAGVMTLQFSVAAMSAGDVLQVIYDDGLGGFVTGSLETGGNLAAISGAAGAQADAAATTDTGSFSLLSFVKRGLQNWTSLLAKIPASVSGRVPVDGSGVTQPVSGSLIEQPFLPVGTKTISLVVAPAVTTAPVALPTATATSVRVRNQATSASPVAFLLSTANTNFAALPTAYTSAGTGGVVGDMMIDPGGVEIVSLSAAQQTAIAAGTLYLSAICAASGSGTLFITSGTGA